MKKMVTALATLSGVFVLSCSDGLAPLDTTGPDLAKVQNEWIPVDLVFLNTCFGEDMHFVGQRKFLLTITDDGDGGFHGNFHRTWTGTVTGLSSGDTYNINFNRGFSEHIRPPFPYVFNQVFRNYITRRGGGKSQLVLREHYTINANGEFVVDRTELLGDCAP